MGIFPCHAVQRHHRAPAHRHPPVLRPRQPAGPPLRPAGGRPPRRQTRRGLARGVPPDVLPRVVEDRGRLQVGHAHTHIRVSFELNDTPTLGAPHLRRGGGKVFFTFPGDVAGFFFASGGAKNGPRLGRMRKGFTRANSGEKKSIWLFEHFCRFLFSSW